jgi:hypothetical protein
VSEKLLSICLYLLAFYSVSILCKCMPAHACLLALILMIRTIYRSCWVELT